MRQLFKSFLILTLVLSQFPLHAFAAQEEVIDGEIHEVVGDFFEEKIEKHEFFLHDKKKKRHFRVHGPKDKKKRWLTQRFQSGDRVRFRSRKKSRFGKWGRKKRRKFRFERRLRRRQLARSAQTPASEDDIELEEVLSGPSESGGSGGSGGGSSGGPSVIPQLASRPGAPATIFLNFLGGEVSTTWCGQLTPPGVWSVSNFSEAQIVEMWQRISEYYSPFNINVTTIDPRPGGTGGFPAYSISLNFSNSSSWYGAAGGVACVGTFGTTSVNNQAWVFTNHLSNNAKYMGTAGGHEAGHVFGLGHVKYGSGGSCPTTYWQGNQSDVAPIMGLGYYKTRQNWFKRNFAQNCSTQDDVQRIVANTNVDYITDNAGDNTGSAKLLTFSGGSVSDAGVIETVTDADYFRFTTNAGTLDLTLTTTDYPMLDSWVEIRDSGNNILTTKRTSSYSETISGLAVGSGVHYAVIYSQNDNPDQKELGMYGLSLTNTGGSNNPPVANGDSYVVNEDTMLNVSAPGVLGNDTDVDSDPLTADLVADVSNGVLNLNSNGSFTYTPSANFNGSDSFTYRAHDGTEYGNTATVNITVNPVNDPPVAVNDSYAVNEDNTLNVGSPGVMNNDSDIDSGSLTAQLISNTSNGNTVLNGANGSFTYTPNANFNGSDSFTYKVNDGDLDSNTATVTITVNAVNDPPTTSDNAEATNEDIAKLIPLPANDVDGDTLFYIIVSGPSNGGLSGTGSSRTYTPNLNSNGADSFTFKVNDGTVDSNTSTISITVNPVNDAPTADPKNIVTTKNVAKSVTLSGSDVDGDPITYVDITSPSNGGLSGTAPNLTYTPSLGFAGADSFTYKVNDGTINSSAATVTITVDNQTPVADNQFPSTDEDTALGITLTGSDPDSDPITFAIVGSPSNGGLTGTAPNVTYTPNADFNGADSFTFKVNDGTVDSPLGTVSITVNPINDAPEATPQSPSTNEDTNLAITLSGTDVDGDTLTYNSISTPSNGILTGTAPNLTYTPNLNYHGSDSFTFKVNDGTVDSAAATISITVNPVNDAPVATNQSPSTNEDTALGITLSGTDVDGDPLTFNSVSSPSNGILTGTAPNLTYTPNANYHGADSFTFKVNDGTVNSANGTISITVNPVNDAPVANNDSVSVEQDVAKSITLTGSDVDGDSLTYAVVTGPSNGALSGTAPNLTYTPNLSYVGPDSFTFKVNDGTVDSSPATITITVNNVNDPPVADNQSPSTNEDTPLALTLTATDPESDPLTFAVVAGPSNGNLTGTPPNVTYTPNLNFNGADSFTFKANDGALDSNIATISITVNPINDAPEATPQSPSTNEDTNLAITLSGTDVDGDTLTYNSISSPSNGILTGTAPNLTYTPNANYHGADSFTFKVNDGTVDSTAATISITVNPVNDAPVADAQSPSTNEDTNLPLTLTGSDVDGDSLTYAIVSGPSNGSLSGTAPNVTYSPNPNFNGSDSFTFKVNDGTVDSPNATVSITVNPVNDTPVANNDSVSTDQDTAKAITLTGSDVDGDTLTYAVVSGPSNGSLSGTEPNLTYTPNLGYVGSDSFTFKVNDGTVDSANATISITVNDVNDPPVANNQSPSTNEDTALAITLTATDADADPLTYAVVAGPTNGSLSGTAPNLTYTPNLHYNGSDSFTFKANDGTVDSNIATVSITVNPVNDAPTANSDSATTNENTAVGITLTGSDVEGSLLSYNIVSGPSNGNLTGSGANRTYTPNTSYVGSDSFTFRVNDGDLDSNTATISITVQAASAGVLQLTTSSASIGEGDGQVTFTVSRTGGTTGAASVDYTTINGSANLGSDFNNGSGTINFANGEGGNKTFSVTILNDNVEEVNETFTVKLQNVTGASLGSTTSASVKINENDFTGITAGKTSKVEAGKTVALTGTLSDRTREGLTITTLWSVKSGPATPSIQNPSSLITEASNLRTPGTYVFEILLRTFDGGSLFHTATAEQTVVVTAPASLAAPLPNNEKNTVTPGRGDGKARVRYNIASSGNITCKILGPGGREVMVKNEGFKGAGTYDIIWDGRSQSGTTVASGIYRLWIFKDGSLIERKKVAVIK